MRFVQELIRRVLAVVVVCVVYALPIVAALSTIGLEPATLPVAEPSRTASFVFQSPAAASLLPEPAPAPEPVVVAEPEPAPEPVARKQRVAAPADAVAEPVAEAAPEPVVAKKEPKPRRKSRQARECDAGDEGVVQVADNSWDIDQDIVDYYVRHLKKAEQLAYTTWHRTEEGKIDGFRVRRMRCGNVLRQAGLENGDIIHSINGKTIRTVPGAIAAYLKLRSKDSFRLTITRNGEKMHLRYKLV
jgi:hypothetical protein